MALAFYFVTHLHFSDDTISHVTSVHLQEVLSGLVVSKFVI